MAMLEKREVIAATVAHQIEYWQGYPGQRAAGICPQCQP
jgi:hypothetical protein